MKEYLIEIKDICRDIEEDLNVFLDVYDDSEFKSLEGWKKCITIEVEKPDSAKKIVNALVRIKRYVDLNDLSILFLDGDGGEHDYEYYSFEEVLNFVENSKEDYVFPSTIFFNNINSLVIYKDEKKENRIMRFDSFILIQEDNI